MLKVVYRLLGALIGQMLAACVILLPASSGFAAEGTGVHIIDYYEVILWKLGLGEHQIEEWAPVLAGFFTLGVLLIIGLRFRAALRKDTSIVPESTFSLRTVVEMLLELVWNLGRDVIGSHEFRRFLPLLSGLFLFILISNLSGLVPGFPPATESINTNLAMGFTVFLIYNVAGIKANGLGPYLKHLLGPVAWLAPLILCIELVSHLARPISLSLRLYGNIFGDHLVLSVFLSSTVGSEAWNSRDLKSRPH